MNTVLTIIISILSSGAVAAIISNVGRDNEWRSNQLSLDKQKLREKLLDNDCGQFLFNPEHYSYDFDLEGLALESEAKYLEIVSAITVYLDFSNKFSQKILSNYEEIKRRCTFIQFLCEKEEFDLFEYHPSNPYLPAQLEGAILTLNRLKLENSHLIQKYFAEYYPKSLTSRIKNIFKFSKNTKERLTLI
ncbi:MAG: hypothetical protein PHC75_06605 [Burkholderiales bacterium]|nr:hypothetical protein [Burkholderiales bacterium]